MKKPILTLLTALLLAPLAALQAAGASKPAGETDPYATEARCEAWQAQWIWSAKSQKEGLPIIYARKSFQLDEVPSSAVIHLSAQRSFKLYVNGRIVGEGPPRNIPPRISYVSFELRSVLRPGENVVVVEAYTDAPDPLGCLIAQLECRGASGTVTRKVITDESWRVCAAPWEPIQAHSAHSDRVEVFDAQREPLQRHAPDFDDSQWEKAFVVAEAGSAKFPYRELEASPLPHYQRTVVPPKKIELAGEVLEVLGDTKLSAGIQMATEIPRPLKHCRITGVENLLTAGGDPAVVENQFRVGDMKAFYNYWDTHDDMPAVRCATVILDFGELMNAYVTLDLEVSAGPLVERAFFARRPSAIVDIAWGQTLIDGRVQPLLYARSKEDPEGKPSSLYAARYLARNGRQQWESYHWQSFRYLQITFRELDGPLKLHRIAAVKSEQPMVERGRFRSADPLLDKLFTSTGKTLRAASYDTFMDGTMREKVIWGGDVSDCAVSSCLPVFGDAPMLRHYLNLFCRSQSKDGGLPATAPGGTPVRWAGHPFRTAIWMAEYGMWCGDTESYATTVLPVLERYLANLKERSDPRGLISLRGPEVDWIDWVTGRKQSDTPTPHNLLHAVLLRKAARTFAAFDKPDLAKAYATRADQICEVVRRDFWDEKQGLYVDGMLAGKPCGSVSEHANYLALLCGLDSEGRQARILQSLNDPERVGEIIQCSPGFMIWPLAGLYAAGEDKQALDLMRRRYARFFVNGGDTFWEEWSWLIGGNGWGARYRSLAQNGTGSPAWFLLTEVLGVKPTAAGFATFEIVPHPSGLAWAEGVVPSPKGDIPVKWKRDGEKFTLEVTVPEGTEATVRLPGSDKKTVLRPGFHTLNNKG